MTQQYCQYIIDILSPWADIICKPMFGGYGVYKNGQIFAIIADEEIYFKVDKVTQPDYEKLNAEQFIYDGKNKPIKMSYWKVPLEILEDNIRLHESAEAAYKVGLRSKK